MTTFVSGFDNWIRGNFVEMNTELGWFSHANPFEFDIRDFRYAENAS